MKKTAITLAILFTFTNILYAQTDFAKEYKPILEKGFNLTIALAEKMPEYLYSFKPEKSAKSFGQQMVHATWGTDVIIDIYVMGNTERNFVEPDAEIMSKEEIIADMRLYAKNALENLDKLTEEQLKEMTNLFEQTETTKKKCIYFVHDHMTNHRAKANLYFRLCGQEPPAYGFF